MFSPHAGNSDSATPRSAERPDRCARPDAGRLPAASLHQLLLCSTLHMAGSLGELRLRPVGRAVCSPSVSTAAESVRCCLV